MVRNAATRASSALSTVSCLPHALSMIAPDCSLTGLISVYGRLDTVAASFSTSAGAAFSLYVTHTAPCSSEWTALISGIGFL